jgi:hypothetical protein
MNLEKLRKAWDAYQELLQDAHRQRERQVEENAAQDHNNGTHSTQVRETKAPETQQCNM